MPFDALAPPQMGLATASACHSKTLSCMPRGRAGKVLKANDWNVVEIIGKAQDGILNCNSADLEVINLFVGTASGTQENSPTSYLLSD